MSKYQKGFGTIGAVVIVVIVLVVGYFKFAKKTEAPVIKDKPIVKLEKMSNCGLTVNTPLGGSTISFPLSVNAIVDNTNSAKLGCSWTVFEAQAGTVKVMNGTTQVGMGILSTTSNWMTTSPVNYTGNVTLSSPVASGTSLTLVFEEENPSGEGIVNTLVVPVVMQ